MTIYRAKTTFGFSFRFECNLSQASSPIWSLPDSEDEDGDGGATPFQCADARHSEWEAALLLLDYFGAEYWFDPTVEVTETDGGDTLYAGMLREDYIRSLLVSVDSEPDRDEPDEAA